MYSSSKRGYTYAMLLPSQNISADKIPRLSHVTKRLVVLVLTLGQKSTIGQKICN